MTHEDLAEKLGTEYACGFAYGLEKGLILANLKPEWARGLYHLVRSHYVQAHPEEDSLDWEEQAERTVWAIPVAIPWREIEPAIRVRLRGRTAAPVAASPPAPHSIRRFLLPRGRR